MVCAMNRAYVFYQFRIGMHHIFQNNDCAPKPNYIANSDSGEVDTESATRMLKAAIPIYTELAHALPAMGFLCYNAHGQDFSLEKRNGFVVNSIISLLR